MSILVMEISILLFGRKPWYVIVGSFYPMSRFIVARTDRRKKLQLHPLMSAVHPPLYISEWTDWRHLQKYGKTFFDSDSRVVPMSPNAEKSNLCHNLTRVVWLSQRQLIHPLAP